MKFEEDEVFRGLLHANNGAAYTGEWVDANTARQLWKENVELRHDLERAMANHSADLNNGTIPEARDTKPPQRYDVWTDTSDADCERADDEGRWVKWDDIKHLFGPQQQTPEKP